MESRCRLILLQFVCLVFPSPSNFAVDSFVLRRRAAFDDNERLAEALYSVQPRPGLDYLDELDDYDVLLPEDEELETDDYEPDAVAEKLMDIINQQQQQDNTAEQSYEDFGESSLMDGDGRSWTGPFIDNAEGFDSFGADEENGESIDSSQEKVPLDKEQLREMFTNADGQPVNQEVEKKTTELTKTDVEKLFKNAANSDDPAFHTDAEPSSQLETHASQISVESPADSATGASEIVKSIEEHMSSGNDGVRDDVIDVKEETILPENGKKLTKEWVIDLVPGADDIDGTPQPVPSGGRKYKRSMGDEFESTAKQRAVDLLKAYIELQEEENHHLTEALNLATLAQTQRTDRYLDDQIKHIKHAVVDESAIETIRDMIRADEETDQNLENDMEQEEQEPEQESEVYNDDDYDVTPAVDLIPSAKRQDDEQISEVFMPPSLVYDERIEDLDYDADEGDAEDRNAFLSERLGHYLDSIHDGDQYSDEYNINDDLLTSQPMDSIYSDLRLNPFSREIEGETEHYHKRYDDTDDNEASAYARDPGWLEDIERAAAIAELRDAVEASTAYQDSEMCPAISELTDNCIAATQHRLTLDHEALQLCNRHQLCYSCGAEFGLTAEICDEGYLRESDLLCSRQSDSAGQLGRCRGEAAGLFVIIAHRHRYLAPGITPGVCPQRCAYDFIVGGR